MPTKPGRPSDDVSSAPESGTIRDDTSGNQPAKPQDRGKPAVKKEKSHPSRQQPPDKDDPSVAGEER